MRQNDVFLISYVRRICCFSRSILCIAINIRLRHFLLARCASGIPIRSNSDLPNGIFYNICVRIAWHAHCMQIPLIECLTCPHSPFNGYFTAAVHVTTSHNTVLNFPFMPMDYTISCLVTLQFVRVHLIKNCSSNALLIVYRFSPMYRLFYIKP